MGKGLVVGWLFFVVACGSTSLKPLSVEPSEARYPVVLHRPMRVGERVRKRIVVEERSAKAVRVNQKEIEREERSLEVELVGDVEVLLVDEAGGAAGVRVTIASVRGKLDGKNAPEVAPGSILVATIGDDGPKFELDGGKLDAEQRRLLAPVVIQLVPAFGHITYDHLFGTSTPHGIGDFWEPNARAFAEDFIGAGIHVQHTRVRGFVGLADRTPCPEGDESCLEVDYEVKAPVTYGAHCPRTSGSGLRASRSRDASRCRSGKRLPSRVSSSRRGSICTARCTADTRTPIWTSSIRGWRASRRGEPSKTSAPRFPPECRWHGPKCALSDQRTRMRSAILPATLMPSRAALTIPPA